MDIFTFDNERHEVIINDPTILLVKEFAALWDKDRNKCKDDKTGTKRLLAYREFIYIYLVLDWLSRYNNYPENERHEQAIEDSRLTDEEFNDPLFREACRKYRDILDSDLDMQLVKATKLKVYDLIDYFNVISDLSLVNDKGTPVYKATDVMNAMKSVDDLIDRLNSLEKKVKEKQKQKSGLRGGREDEYTPNLGE